MNNTSENLNFTIGEKFEALCLDHHSVIQTFYQDAILKLYQEAGEIDRHRRIMEQAKGLIKDRHNLEDYDDITRVIEKFRKWRSSYFSDPKILHAHGFNKKGEPIQATWQALNRFESTRNIEPLSEALNNYQGPGVFLTLTVEHSLSLRDAWENISKRWNTFMTRLTKELGINRSDLHYVWVLEAQGNGYPHIHAIFLGIDYLFYAGNKRQWIEDNPHSKNLKHFWKWGSVFVNATRQGQGIRNPVSYMMKYIRKTFNQDNDETGKKELTQALLWAFNKRSFNMSRKIFQFLNYEKPERENSLTLHGMGNFEVLNGQASPLVRIVSHTQIPIETEELEIFTDEDLDYLAERSGMMWATKEEQNALKFLLEAHNRGKTDFVYYVRPKIEKTTILSKYRSYLRNGNND